MQIRPAVEDDLDAMVEAMMAEPGAEQVAFMPTIAGARRFLRELWSLAGLDGFVVAIDGDDVIGFAWCSEDDISLRQGARAAVAGWGPLGPVRLVAKGWPRRSVDLPMPPGPKLHELQVHPARRGGGIGSALLEHVLGTTTGRPVSLTTRTDNEARHLYERHGFEVVAERDSPSFEARTGARGRILMVRPARVDD